MSYRIDGETPYWGGLEVPCNGRTSTSFDVKDWKKAQEDALKSVTDGVVDYISEEMARVLAENFEEHRKACKEFREIIEKIEQMEKRKNKMTKAEAFEWLRGTKVVLRTIDDQLDLQKRLFDIGYKWRLSGTQLLRLYDVSCVFFLGIDGFIQHEEYEDESNKLFCDTHVYKPIELCDILSIEIVEGPPKFSYEKVVELAKPLMEYLNDTGCSERICVTYEGIVAEPMATFLHGQMKGC